MSSTPEAPLQFDCPACGAVLTVPASIAGMQGPCPKCWQEIISPDPAIGMPARLPALPKADAPVEPPAPEPVPVSTPAPVAPPEPEPALTTIESPKPAPVFPRRLDPPPSADMPPEPEPAPLPAFPPKLDPAPAPAFPPKLDPAPAPAFPPKLDSTSTPGFPPKLDSAPSPVLPPEAAPIFPPRLDPAPTPGSISGPPPAPLRAEDIPALQERERKEAATAAPRPRSKALLVVGIVVPLLALGAAGYYFAKDYKPNIIDPSTVDQPAHQPPAPTPKQEPLPEPAPTPDETGQGLLIPPTPPSSEAADAQAALIAFLGAPDWQARSAFVLSPDEIRPEMEKHAKEHGDGPIPASAIQLLEVAPPNLIFKVCTKAIPDGFPVPVTLTDEGPKIDWEAFIAFNDDHFRKLLAGPTDHSGILNLLVKPETGTEPSPHWVRYRLSVPMPGREATAWVRKDSVALARLKSIFDGENGLTKDTVDKLVAETGVPLRLAITKRKTNDGREFLEVVDMVAVGWAPAKQD